MDKIRILKGYSKNQQKELEEAKNNNYSSAMILIHGIGEEYSDCQALSEKYYHEDANEDNQLARDITDYYAGVAKFPDKKYYVKLIRNDDDGYLNKGKLNTFVTLGNCRTSHYYQTEFTEQEIKAIDPRYMAFAVLLEEDDE